MPKGQLLHYGAKFSRVPNCPRCQIVCGAKLSTFTHGARVSWCQTVPNCPLCQIAHFYPWCQIVGNMRGAKLSWCQIVLGPCLKRIQRWHGFGYLEDNGDDSVDVDKSSHEVMGKKRKRTQQGREWSWCKFAVVVIEKGAPVAGSAVEAAREYLDKNQGAKVDLWLWWPIGANSPWLRWSQLFLFVIVYC